MFHGVGTSAIFATFEAASHSAFRLTVTFRTKV